MYSVVTTTRGIRRARSQRPQLLQIAHEVAPAVRNRGTATYPAAIQVR